MLLKDRIVAESTNLFVRNGVKSVRMDDIASRLGVSKRTIYELFGDRESLIVECVRHFYASQDEKHDRRVASARNVIEEFIQRGQERLKGSLKKGIDEGLFFPELNLDFTAVALMASINTIFASPSVYDEVHVSVSDAFKYITMCFFRGISTKEGIHIIDDTFRKHFPGGLFGQNKVRA